VTAGDDDPVLAEQLAYYEARAPEYDDWFLRRGRYDRGAEYSAAWADEVSSVRNALSAGDWRGRHVLELAPGTGLWTQWLLSQGATVSVAEGSAAMVQQLTQRVGADAIAEVLMVDLFHWAPPHRYDGVFFGFFLSHVRRGDLDAFMGLVRSALSPGGLVGFVDSRRDPLSSAVDHVLPSGDEETMVRRLDDGREFEVVKVFYEPDQIESAAERAGLSLRAALTDRFFLYGRGRG
jgi:SAM-dependent methyltransferase